MVHIYSVCVLTHVYANAYSSLIRNLFRYLQMTMIKGYFAAGSSIFFSLFCYVAAFSYQTHSKVLNTSSDDQSQETLRNFGNPRFNVYKNDSVSGTSFVNLIPLPEHLVSYRQRAEVMTRNNVDLQKAMSFKHQLPPDSSTNLNFLQNQECDGIFWGNREILTEMKSLSGLSSVKNWLESCDKEGYNVTSSVNTYTWRQCAKMTHGRYIYFSWNMEVGALSGVCTLIEALTTEAVTDIKKCFKPVKADGSIGVAGIATDESLCTSCAVGVWQSTPCDLWCYGLRGKYRFPTMYVGSDHCISTDDKNCDKCQNLWEFEKCGRKQSCGAPIAVGKHYCPSEDANKNVVKSWRECSAMCHAEFIKAGGDSTNPGTYTSGNCFMYSYENTTSTCEMKHLKTCEDTFTTEDALWLSGNILNMPTPDFTTTVWSSWTDWSGCEGIDVERGWSRRIRSPVSWGFLGDSEYVSKHLSDLISCKKAGGVPMGNEAQHLGHNTKMTCCIHGDFLEWASFSCDPVCGYGRVRTRRRPLLQNPIPGSNLLSCDAKYCKEVTDETQKQQCPDRPECSSECMYGSWTGWTSCLCKEGAIKGGFQKRLRNPVLEKDNCPADQEERDCDTILDCSTAAEFDAMQPIAIAGGVGGVILLSAVAGYFASTQSIEANAVDTL